MDETFTIAIEADTTGFETALKALEKQASGFGTTLTGALKSAIVSGKSLEDTLRSIALNLAGSALQAGLAPLQSILNAAGSKLVSSILPAIPFADGGVLSGGAVIARPSYFPMGGGRTGLMGEAGPEAIMPLGRTADGRLGVVAQDSARSGPPVIVNISTPDIDGFRRSEMQVSAALARAVDRGRRGQ